MLSLPVANYTDNKINLTINMIIKMTANMIIKG